MIITCNWLPTVIGMRWAAASTKHNDAFGGVEKLLSVNGYKPLDPCGILQITSPDFGSGHHVVFYRGPNWHLSLAHQQRLHPFVTVLATDAPCF